MTKKKQSSSERRSGKKSGESPSGFRTQNITGKQIFSDGDGNISELEDRSWLDSGKHPSCLCTVQMKQRNQIF